MNGAAVMGGNNEYANSGGSSNINDPSPVRDDYRKDGSEEPSPSKASSTSSKRDKESRGRDRDREKSRESRDRSRDRDRRERRDRDRERDFADSDTEPYISPLPLQLLPPLQPV